MKTIRMSEQDDARWSCGDPNVRRIVRDRLRSQAAHISVDCESVEIHFADGMCADVVYPQWSIEELETACATMTDET